MKKDKHDIAYFLSNKYFVNWVKHPNEENDAFWREWLRNHPESHEYCNKARTIIERINFSSEARIGERKEEILHLILQGATSPSYKLGKEKRPWVKEMLPIAYKLVAASLVLLLMSTYFFSSFSVYNAENALDQVKFITKSNPKGQKTSFYLPDKTKVFLNSESSISYSTDFEGVTREVFLEGEAYFDVSHDMERSFLVRSGEIVTQVHGTAFDVSAYPGEPVSIALERGLVSVYPHSAESPVIPYFLKPGEMLDVHPDFEQSAKSNWDHGSEFGWKEGQLVFKRTGFEELVNKLERWYNVHITVQGEVSESWRVNGVFDNESLQNVLEGIRYARGISYELKGNEVLIKL